ncbi:hypothetical protein TNCV_4257511 [Trichonephila clavipes]|nr:hypothetical protein TNCV_4257511 [Trichonephila clavipes]
MQGCKVLLQSVPVIIKTRMWFQHYVVLGRDGPSLVDASPVDSDEALVARIAVIAGEFREMPGVFASVQQSLRRRCEVCIFVEYATRYSVADSYGTYAYYEMSSS